MVQATLQELINEKEALIRKIKQCGVDLQRLSKRKLRVEKLISAELSRLNKIAVVPEKYKLDMSLKQKTLFMVHKYKQADLETIVQKIVTKDKASPLKAKNYYTNICKTLERLIQKEVIIKIEGKYQLHGGK